MNTSIKFYRSEESSVIHEQYENREDSIFADQYEFALNVINRFLDIRERRIEKSKINNIFAFIGDRGMGKTSCMESVAEMIPKCRKERFKIIDTIDPSFFDKDRNILEMVIGKMFAEFSEDASNTSLIRNKDFESKKEKLIFSFKAVRHTIAKMKSDEVVAERGSISKLQDLSSASTLAKDFHSLVTDFLTYFDSNVLILPIDDIDLNTSMASMMVEQLRKYLIQENVIILMAVKLSQLSFVMEQDYARQYGTLLKEQLIEKSAVKDMVIKYLTKLIPLDHRIYLPAIDTYFDTELQLFDDKKGISEPVLSGSSVKYTVTSLIFRKCRYLFYHSKGITSPVVPNNLRDLRYLIEMLYQMADYKDSTDTYNKEIFRNYLFETWMPDNLDWDGCKSINELNSIKNAAIFNSMVLSHLQKRFALFFRLEQPIVSRRPSLQFEQSEFELIINSKNSTYNISVGDVFAILSQIKKTLNKHNDEVYIFLIETLYSFRLYHYYDEMTEKTTSGETNSVDESIKKIEKVDGLYNYEILTAGSLINTLFYNELSDEKITNQPRVIRPILLKPLRDCIDELSNIEGEWSDEQTMKLQMLEFFTLHISHPYYNDRGRINSKYRCEKDIYYTIGFGPEKKYVIFNLNSIFTNLCNITRTYNRIDKKLINLASANEQSIYNQMRNKVKTDRHPIDDSKEELRHCFLSWSLIRNAEILEDFSEYIANASYQIKRSHENTKIFAEYYRDIARYNIKTYDKDDDKPYVIQFDFYSILDKVLSNMDENMFNQVFSAKSEEKDILNINDIMKKFKNGQEYTRLGVIRTLSSSCQDIFEIKPEIKEKIRTAFVNKYYSYDEIQSLLEQFKNANNL